MPREQRVPAAVRELRADGLRWQDVADRLNAGGAAHRPRNADAWTAAGLAKSADGPASVEPADQDGERPSRPATTPTAIEHAVGVAVPLPGHLSR